MKRYGANREAKQAWVDLVSAAMPSSGRRTRPRDPDKARLLAERGTPSQLIGPIGGKRL